MPSSPPHGKLAMSACLLAPLAELVGESYNLVGVGADAILLPNAIQQRLEKVLPGRHSPAATTLSLCLTSAPSRFTAK